jgi:murein tripeptide amidase MpaA
MASDLLTVAIHAEDIEELRELVRTRPYDFGCRPHAICTEEGDYILPALLTRHQYDELKKEDIRVDIVFEGVPDDRAAKATIGKGDRFHGGKLAPRGLGSRRQGEGQDLGGIMNVDEIDSAVKGLVEEYGIPTFSPPNKTSEGSGGGGGLVGGGINPDNYHIYFTAGVHARERGGPDNLIYFIADLLYAQKHGIGLTYGARSFSNADVLRALSTGIVFFPLVNPDGVRFDQQTDSLWRKNRNPASAIPGDKLSIGVDINRNYDFLWDYHLYFDPSITSTSLASDDPHDETFHGIQAFSEPESRNVAWVFDQFPRLRWYVDIHSAVGDMLYNWGDDDNQASDPKETFLNPAWDGKRGIVGKKDYKEWITESDWSNIRVAANRVTGAMSSVGGRTYSAEQAVGLYAVSGASLDYAFSRFQVDHHRNKVYGFTMEFGHPTNFYPTTTEFQQNVIDTGAGFMEFCLAAADIGLV